MSVLPDPMEFVDLEHGASMVLHVTHYQDGSTLIHPRDVTPRHISIYMAQKGLTEPPPPGMPISNEIPMIRLHGARLDSVSPSPYFDFTSKTLRADLLARLAIGNPTPITIKLTANGSGQRKRYSVEVM